MNSAKKIVSTLILSASFCASAQDLQNEAESNENRFKFIGGLGLTFGGDDLLDVGFADGSSEELEAGGLFDLKAGVLYELASSGMSLQTTIGYHGDRIDAENGEASFSRIPVDVLGFYNIDKHRVGVGSTYHFNTNLDVDFGSVGLSADADAEDTIGMVVEYGFEASENLIIGVRYVDIEYTFEDTDIKVDGSHAGIYAYITY